MAAGNFSKCHEVTAKWEGGWSDHPADPGGKTMYGVTEAVFHAWLKARGKPLISVRYITKPQALAIYTENYWNAAKCEGLAAGVDLATYDAAVNSGVGRARKWLDAAIGGANVDTVKRICAKRLGFVQALKTWKTFGKGWTRRIADIEAKGVAWALAAVANAPVTKGTLEREATEAQNKARQQTSGGAATGGGGAVATQVPVDNADQAAAIALAGFIVVAALVAGYLLWRAHINRTRAAAFAAEASKVN